MFNSLLISSSSFFYCLSFRILKFSSSCDLDITMFLYWNVSVDWQFKSYALRHIIASRCILAVTNKGLTSWLLNLKVTAVTQSQRQTHTYGQKYILGSYSVNILIIYLIDGKLNENLFFYLFRKYWPLSIYFNTHVSFSSKVYPFPFFKWGNLLSYFITFYY